MVGHKNEARHDNLHDLASPLSRKNILILATPSMGEHNVSERNGKKYRIWTKDQLSNTIAAGLSSMFVTTLYFGRHEEILNRKILGRGRLCLKII